MDGRIGPTYQSLRRGPPEFVEPLVTAIEADSGPIELLPSGVF